MKLSQKTLFRFGAIIAATLMLLTLLIAPQNSKSSRGSTYGRSPDGYSAWYTFMADRGTAVERWQKPIAQLSEKYDSGKTTLLNITPDLSAVKAITFPDYRWLENGNYLVILGQKENPTAANFSNIYNRELGSIKIDTTRRKKQQVKTSILDDKFGSIIWSEKVGKGKIIYSTTPYLAANAYQDWPGNYELLAKLTAENGRKVVVNEYIHGYKDAETIAAEAGRTLTDYLAKTPLIPVAIQVLLMLVVGAIAHNFRFGRSQSLNVAKIDNSTAYIQALGGVLQKAETSQFVMEAIGKVERQNLQRKLGLGSDAVTDKQLIEAWQQQTGKPIDLLQYVLKYESQNKHIKETDLVLWLGKWQEINRYFSN